MTGRDDAGAVDLIARHLTGRLHPGIDPRLVAAHLVDILREHGWRPIPRPEPITAQGPGAPPTREWREAADRIRNRQEESR